MFFVVVKVEENLKIYYRLDNSSRVAAIYCGVDFRNEYNSKMEAKQQRQSTNHKVDDSDKEKRLNSAIDRIEKEMVSNRCYSVDSLSIKTDYYFFSFNGLNNIVTCKL